MVFPQQDGGVRSTTPVRRREVLGPWSRTRSQWDPRVYEHKDSLDPMKLLICWSDQSTCAPNLGDLNDKRNDRFAGRSADLQNGQDVSPLSADCAASGSFDS